MNFKTMHKLIRRHVNRNIIVSYRSVVPSNLFVKWELI